MSKVGESREIVKQTDFGFGVDTQADPGGSSSPDSPCLSGLSRMTLSWVGTPMLAPGMYERIHMHMGIDVFK